MVILAQFCEYTKSHWSARLKSEFLCYANYISIKKKEKKRPRLDSQNEGISTHLIEMRLFWAVEIPRAVGHPNKQQNPSRPSHPLNKQKQTKTPIIFWMETHSGNTLAEVPWTDTDAPHWSLKYNQGWASQGGWGSCLWKPTSRKAHAKEQLRGTACPQPSPLSHISCNEID